MADYQRGLSEEIKDLLVRDTPTSLNELCALAHRLDDQLRERRLERTPAAGERGPGHISSSLDRFPTIPDSDH